MKVHTKYRDGQFYLEPAKEKSWVPIVEIPEDTWREYQLHLDKMREWNEYIMKLEATEDYQRQLKEGWARYHATKDW